MTDSEKIDLLLAEITGMKQDISDMKRGVSGMEQGMSGMKQDISGMKQDISGMKQDMSGMKQDIELLKQKVLRVELMIENEIRVNIQRVAEGHLDLSRNLHKAMKPSNEVEMLALKVRKLELDVEDLKAKIC